jgi:hypothetical protein
MRQHSSRLSGKSSWQCERQLNLAPSRDLSPCIVSISRGSAALLCYLASGDKGEVIMENTFASWRSAAVGLGLTVAVVGAGLALAFW